MKTFQQLRRQSRTRRTVAIKPHADADRTALREVLGYAAPSPVEVQRKYDGCERQGEGNIEETRGREDMSPLGPSASAQAAIAAGKGGGQSLPAGQRAYYESRLGFDLGQVRIHADDHAARLSARLAARAFTTGSDVYFAGGQYRPETGEGRFLLAHELTHVAQQGRGVQLEGGMGRVGDAHERQADSVAERVARGESVSNLGHVPAATPAAGAAPVQRYAEITGLSYDRLSDDGKMAVKDHKRDAWAESANIANSNKVLDGLKSKVKIEELSGKDITVSPPGKTTASTLKKFRMINRVGGGEAELVDDCGGANQQILGSETAGYESFVGVNQLGTTEEYTAPSKYEGDDNAAGGLVSTTERMSGEIYIRIFQREYKKTLNRVDALKAWDALPKATKDSLSKKYGINQYAVPKVGQGVTIGSERDMPGASENGYNFHFGFNLMASGHDYITLEDYDRSGVKYYFDMYGPESKKQSWAQEKSNVDAVDDKFTVMVVQHPESLKGIVNASGAYFEADPAAMTGTRPLDKDTKVVILRKGINWMKVEVKSGKYAGQSGWILNKFYTDN